jgi:hypothetical protein
VIELAHPMANFEDHRFGGDVRGDIYIAQLAVDLGMGAHDR